MWCFIWSESKLRREILIEDGDTPVRLKPATRLEDDLDSLAFLLDGSVPKRVPVILKSTRFIHYRIRDASSDSYGADIHFYINNGQRRSIESTNYCELNNLVTVVEQLYKDGYLKNYELFMH